MVFASNAIFSCFLLVFLLMKIYFLIPAVIAQIFVPTTELPTPAGTPTNEGNAKIETQRLTAETKTRTCSK